MVRFSEGVHDLDALKQKVLAPSVKAALKSKKAREAIASEAKSIDETEQAPAAPASSQRGATERSQSSSSSQSEGDRAGIKVSWRRREWHAFGAVSRLRVRLWNMWKPVLILASPRPVAPLGDPQPPLTPPDAPRCPSHLPNLDDVPHLASNSFRVISLCLTPAIHLLVNGVSSTAKPILHPALAARCF
jgi:hypothetical protein